MNDSKEDRLKIIREFNECMARIVGLTQSVLSQLDRSSLLHEDLIHLREYTHRASQLAARLLPREALGESKPEIMREPDSEAKKQEPQPSGDCPSRILIVEDQDIIRKMTTRLLISFGYSVVEAANGKEGYEIFKNMAGEINIVILDLTMPIMDGKEMFYKVKSIKPSVKVIITSGYPKNDLVKELIREGVAGFLQKPFTVEELSDLIRDLAKET